MNHSGKKKPMINKTDSKDTTEQIAIHVPYDRKSQTYYGEITTGIVSILTAFLVCAVINYTSAIFSLDHFAHNIVGVLSLVVAYFVSMFVYKKMEKKFSQIRLDQQIKDERIFRNELRRNGYESDNVYNVNTARIGAFTKMSNNKEYAAVAGHVDGSTVHLVLAENVE